MYIFSIIIKNDVHYLIKIPLVCTHFRDLHIQIIKHGLKPSPLDILKQFEDCSLDFDYEEKDEACGECGAMTKNGQYACRCNRYYIDTHNNNIESFDNFDEIFDCEEDGYD